MGKGSASRRHCGHCLGALIGWAVHGRPTWGQDLRNSGLSGGEMEKGRARERPPPHARPPHRSGLASRPEPLPPPASPGGSASPECAPPMCQAPQASPAAPPAARRGVRPVPQGRAPASMSSPLAGFRPSPATQNLQGSARSAIPPPACTLTGSHGSFRNTFFSFSPSPPLPSMVHNGLALVSGLVSKKWRRGRF